MLGAVAGRGHSLLRATVTCNFVFFASHSPFPPMSLYLNLSVFPCACQRKLCPENNSWKSQNHKNELVSEAQELQAKARVPHDKRVVTKQTVPH